MIDYVGLPRLFPPRSGSNTFHWFYLQTKTNCTFRLFMISGTSENWMYLVRTVAAALLSGGKTWNVVHRVCIWKQQDVWTETSFLFWFAEMCFHLAVERAQVDDVTFPPNATNCQLTGKWTFPSDKKNYVFVVLFSVWILRQVVDDLTLVIKSPGVRSQDHIYGSRERTVVRCYCLGQRDEYFCPWCNRPLVHSFIVSRKTY